MIPAFPAILTRSKTIYPQYYAHLLYYYCTRDNKSPSVQCLLMFSFCVGFAQQYGKNSSVFQVEQPVVFRSSWVPHFVWLFVDGET